MTVHLYAACWNEIDRLDAFFAHYDHWVDRYFIYDDGSDDGSLERLARHDKVTQRQLVRAHELSLVLSLRDLYDHAWKASRGEADWVVVVNVDEFLQHADMQDYLRRCRTAGCTVLPSLGYEIVSPLPPHKSPPLWGTPNVFSNKLAIFDPAAITEVHYDVGRHSAHPSGRVRYPPRDELLNFHFKYHEPELALARMRMQGVRLRPLDLQNGWGAQYHWDDRKFAAWIDTLRSRAIRLDASHNPDRENLIPRWWRPNARLVRSSATAPPA